VRLLLDTHIAIWAIADHSNLSVKARNLINDPDNAIVVSITAVWEIAIKHALARGGANDMPVSGDEALRFFREAGFEMLDISPTHAAAVESLALLYDDPFDRLLVAQAMTVPLRLVTHDQKVAAYSDSIILV
jgi:PIN domain nuclease of toxin-antitoxin system